jgi:hypothetical protein
MKFLAASVALILLPLSASAQGTQWDMAGLPPVEYDKSFAGIYHEIRGTAEFMARKCPKTPWPVTLGCAIHNTQRDSEERVVTPATECVVYIATDDILKQAGWTYEVVMRHERGHCNGWPQSHSGARYSHPDARMSDEQREFLNRKISQKPEEN